MNNQPFTGAHFAEFCLSMVGQPYWYGTCLYKCSESLRERKARQYPSHYSTSRTARYRRDVAREKICADCIGGAKGYAWTNGGQGVVDSIGIPGSPKSKYASNNCPDKSANGMFKYAKSRNQPWGTIGTLPEVPGLALHKDGHVGYYVGNGYAVEWRGFKYGCVRTKVADRGWKYWYQLPFLHYGSIAPRPSLLGTRLLRRGMRGEDVKELQSLLIRLDYSLPKFGADGDFGSETRAALKQFQKGARIEVDGVYGEESHAALMRAVSDLQGDTPIEQFTTAGEAASPKAPDAGDAAVPISISEIEPPPAETLVPAAPLPRLTIVSAQSADVRAGNAPDFALLTFAPPGASFDCIATAANGWHAVSIGGQVGWISGELARLEAPAVES